MEEELDLLDDDEVKGLVRGALERGAPDFVAGYEIDGQPIEAAWANEKVAVMPSGNGTEIPGWDIRSVDQWTVDELLRSISETS